MWIFRRTVAHSFIFCVYFWNKVLRASLSEKLFVQLSEWLNLFRRLHGGFKWLLSTSIIFFFFFFNLMYNLWPSSPPVTPSSDASMSRLLCTDPKCCRNRARFSCLLMYLMRGVRWKWLLWEYACLFDSNMRTCWSKWNMAEGHQSEEGAVYTVITFMD